MKFILRRVFFLLLPVITGLSCHQNSFNLEKALLRTERILVEVSSVLEDEIILELDESVEESSIPEFKDLTLVSWNIQHLGRSKTDEEIWQMAQILRHFDIVAIQEVVAKDPAGAQAVAKLADELNRTGANWDYQVSNPTISPSVYISERYAFLWKTSKVTLQHRAFLDSEREDLFFREPFIAKFK